MELNPDQTLTFRRPFSEVREDTFTITNKESVPIAFKVKTTSPKTYCVRPNSGVLEPHATKSVTVLLQPMKEEPPLTEKCKDKFLIQSITITDKEASLDPAKLTNLWREYDADETKKKLIVERKLKCTFLPPESKAKGETTDARGPSAAATAPKESSTRDRVAADSLTYSTPLPQPSTPTPSLEEQYMAAVEKNRILTSEIEKLKSQSSSLRQRSVASDKQTASPGAAMSTKKQPSGGSAGLSVPLVVFLCLVMLVLGSQLRGIFS